MTGFRSHLRLRSFGAKRLLLAFGFAIALVVVTPIAAFAFFTYTDSSNAHPAAARANSLSAPLSATATPGSTSITVGWSLPGSQLTGAQYKVTRTSGPGSPVTVCTVASNITSCDDTGLLTGTYGYSIIAVLGNWESSAISASSSVNTTTTVSQSAPGTYNLSVPAGVTSFNFDIKGGGGGGGDSGSGSAGAAGASGGSVSGTVTIPISVNPTNFTVVVGGGGGRGNGGTGGTGGTGGPAASGCAAGGNGGTNSSGAGGGGGGGATCIYLANSPASKVVIAGGGGGGGGFGTAGVGGGGGGVTANPGTSSGVDGANGSGSNGGDRGITVTSGGSSPFTVTTNTGGPGGSSNGSAASCTLTGCNAGGNGGGGALAGNGGGGGGGMASGGGGASTFIANGGGGGGGSAYAGGTSGATVAASGTNGSALNGGGSETAGTGGSASFTGTGLTLALPASKLAFTQQPSGATGGSAFTTQPQVTVQDALGNTVTTDVSTVTLTIAPSTPTSGGPGTLANCVGTETAGVFTFSGCEIDKIGTGYKLRATDGSLTLADSAAFNVGVGPASQLAFTTQPSGATGGSAFTTQPKVTVRDAGGNTVTTDSSTAVLTIGTNPAGGALSGCTQTESLGVISFAGCKIDKAGTGYTLHVTDGALDPADSSAFNVAAGAPATASFTQEPSATSTGGIAFAVQPQVTIKDAGGNVVPSTSVNLAVTAGSGGDAGGTLSCTTNPVTTNPSGIATFAGCSINTAALAPYTLTATAGSATTVSTGIVVSVGPAAKLAFTQPPAGATGGTVFTTQPKVTVQDAGGNTVVTDVSTATLAITPGTGSGTLSGCSAIEAAGVFTFSGCKIDTAGNGYKLRATDGALTLVDSSAFNVTVGPANKLAFTQQPSTSATGSLAFPTQPKVTVQDAGGNTVTTDSSTATLSITGGTPATGGPGTLSGCSATETAGVFTFSGCSISTAGTGYKLRVTDGSLTVADSNTIDITSAAIGLTPTSGNVSSLATITANGFKASQSLTVTVGGTSATINSGATSGANGSSTINFTIPTVPGGARAVVVSDGTNSATSAINFTVTASATGLSPTTGTVGTAGVNITARGFNASATLTVKVGGVNATITSGATAAANGTSTVVFTIPAVGNGSQSVVVSDGTNTATSATNFTVDATAPTLTVTATGPSVIANGTTVYFKATGTGTFTVTAADPESGVTSSTFPNAPTGWTRTTGTNTATYTLTSASSTVSLPGFSATNGVGATTNATLSLVNDVTAPTGGALTVNGTAASAGGTTSTNNTGTFTIGTRTDYAEAQSGTQSGLLASVLTVASAPLSNNACGSFGTPNTIIGSPSQSQVGGFCYQYLLQGMDNVGNLVSINTTVKVDTTAPIYTLTATGATVATTGTNAVSYNTGSGSFTITASDPETGINGTPTFSGTLSGWTRTTPTNAVTYTLNGSTTATATLNSGFSAANNAGLTNTSFTVTITRDQTRPTVSALSFANGGSTVGTIEPGDVITITYSEAISVSTLCTTWTGNSTNQSIGTVTVTLDNDPENFTIGTPCGNIASAIGTDNNYLSSSPKSWTNSTIAYNVTTRQLTITLGATSGGGSLNNDGSSAPTITPTANVKDLVGNTMLTTTLTPSGTSRF